MCAVGFIMNMYPIGFTITYSINAELDRDKVW